MKFYDDDGREPLPALLAAFDALTARGWTRDTIALSTRAAHGGPEALPMYAFRTSTAGPALWILSGIHGEEPAGPGALAAEIGKIADLGARVPVVLLPLCNPLGYASNWRYPRAPAWRRDAPAASVGDCEHVLPRADDPTRARTEQAACPESAALAAYVLRQARDYPPLLVLDLHEDDQIPGGYVYSAGADEAARRVIALYRRHGMPLQEAGVTRFGEAILGGVVQAGTDGSIDELLAAPQVVVDGEINPGPGAPVLVLETSAQRPLLERVACYRAVVRDCETWLERAQLRKR